MSPNPDSPKQHEPSKGKTSETQTGVGQEATRGQNPNDRSRTHQSNYGGGGENGGAEKKEDRG